MMRRYSLYPFIAVFILLLASSCKDNSAPAPYGVLPSPKQVEWQKMEYYMFVHFGPNTFTDVEWGNGRENPDVFAPTDLDCRQWADVAKQAGMKGIIITGKHHDGFCLWPSAYSTHTVRESSWRDGKGDVLKELSDACAEYGLKFGVYVSPWDQNHPLYGEPGYNEAFAGTLSEVLSNYGDVFELWLDGAYGGHPDSTFRYDWKLFHETAYSKRPDLIIFSDIGPDCRWVGNERGKAPSTNWSRLDTDGYAPGGFAPSHDTLGQGNVHGKYWIPAECDVSIRPGWFYSASTDDKLKSVEQLMDIYYSSVGHNGTLLLNVPADRRGKIPAVDSLRLMEFAQARKEAFSTDYARGAEIVADAVRGDEERFGPQNMTDGEYDTYWTTDDAVTSASFVISFEGKTTVSGAMIQEYIPLGQRVKAFSIEYAADENGEWTEIFRGTTIGYKRLVRFDSVEALKLRFKILDSYASPVINNVEVY